MADVLYHFHFHFQNYALHEKGFPHIHQPTHFHSIIIFAITPNSICFLLKFHLDNEDFANNHRQHCN